MVSSDADMSMGEEDDLLRRVVGRVLRAAEHGEVEALLASIDRAEDRDFISELAALALREQGAPPAVTSAPELDSLYPTSAELLIEEELEDELELASPKETEVFLWLARARESGAEEVWRRTLELLSEARADAQR